MSHSCQKLDANPDVFVERETFIVSWDQQRLVNKEVKCSLIDAWMKVTAPNHIARVFNFFQTNFLIFIFLQNKHFRRMSDLLKLISLPSVFCCAFT